MPNLVEQIREALSLFALADAKPTLIYVNDATRTRDLDDIRALVKIHRASIDRVQLREYFELFNQTELLNELIAENSN